MHIFLKVGLVFLVLAIVTVVITVPLVLHLRPKANETLSSNETTTTTTVSTKQSSTSTVPTTTTTKRRNDDTTSTVTSTIINVPCTTTISIIEDTTTPSTTMHVEIDTSTISTPSMSRSVYSSILSDDTQTYCREDPCLDVIYYFQAIQINVPMDGLYTIFSGSNMNTYGYIYHSDFIPANPTVNLIAENDDDAGVGQFMLPMMLQAMENYILVVTTYGANVTGESSIIVIGPELVSFTPLYISNNGNEIIKTSTYTSELTYNSRMFPHESNPNITYYYEVVAIYVSISGNYTIMSRSGIDILGDLYNDSFNPDDTHYNLLKSDDDSGGDGQFMFSIMLESTTKYILRVRTYHGNAIGAFSIIAKGEASVTFESA